VVTVGGAENPLAVLGALRAAHSVVDAVVDDDNAQSILDLAWQGGRGADLAERSVRRKEEVVGRTVSAA
jgi:hypothetical protein